MTNQNKRRDNDALFRTPKLSVLVYLKQPHLEMAAPQSRVLTRCPIHGFKHCLSKANSREDSNFSGPTLQSHSLPCMSVHLKVWPSALLSKMSPSSARAASTAGILAMSVRSCSVVWALDRDLCLRLDQHGSASRSVSPLLVPFLRILDCTLLFCFTVLLATVLCSYRCPTEAQNSTQHSHTSFLSSRSWHSETPKQ